MNPPTGSVTAEAKRSRFGRFWPPLLIALAGAAAYANSFSGPFVFDDTAAIADNPTIRHLWPIGSPLSPPSGGLTVSGRPVLNLTLAFNYALGGTHVWGYHALNLAIHILAGLTLFGIVRRTLLRRENRADFATVTEVARLSPGIARLLAFAVALLWTLHPLQTESVTYVVQRAESLMGLFYLLTLYCFIRSVEADGEAKAWRLPLQAESGTQALRGLREGGRHHFAMGWAVLSFVACVLGMATKEVMVSAPIMVLMYDRTFVVGSFREAWRRRRALYLGLASTWILLAFLVIGGGGGRSGSVGFGAGVSGWAYGLTQFQAIVRYLQLAAWPHPLVFEYGTFWVKSARPVALCACVVVPLVAATVVALRRWPAWGFLGFWFFAILAPTSLVPGTTQMIVEHRMYLALAPVLVAIVCGFYALIERAWGQGADGSPARTVGQAAVDQAVGSAPGQWPGLQSGLSTVRRSAAPCLIVLSIFAAICCFLTRRRNEDYRTEVALWRDTVAKRPENALAHNNLGTALEKRPGHLNDAIAQYQEAIRLDPGFHEAHNNLGNAWLEMPGRLNDAIAEYREALRLRPDFAPAHNDLGNAWSKIPGRLNDAIGQYQEALRLKPDYAGAHNNLGKAWLELPGKLNDAIAQFEEALRLNPDFAEAHDNLGSAWANLPGRLNDAIAQFEVALRLDPDDPEAHNNLGNAWSNLPGRLNDAIAQLEEALRLKPDYPEAHNNLGNAWANLPGKWNAAVAQYREALRLKPDYAEAHYNLAVALLQVPGRRDEAKAQLEAFLRLRPQDEGARQALGALQAPQ